MQRSEPPLPEEQSQAKCLFSFETLEFIKIKHVKNVICFKDMT